MCPIHLHVLLASSAMISAWFFYLCINHSFINILWGSSIFLVAFYFVIFMVIKKSWWTLWFSPWTDVRVCNRPAFTPLPRVALIFLGFYEVLIYIFSYSRPMVIVLVSKLSSPGSITDWGHCGTSVLGKDTLLSQCLSPLRGINGYQQNKCWV